MLTRRGQIPNDAADGANTGGTTPVAIDGDNNSKHAGYAGMLRRQHVNTMVSEFGRRRLQRTYNAKNYQWSDDEELNEE